MDITTVVITLILNIFSNAISDRFKRLKSNMKGRNHNQKEDTKKSICDPYFTVLFVFSMVVFICLVYINPIQDKSKLTVVGTAVTILIFIFNLTNHLSKVVSICTKATDELKEKNKVTPILLGKLFFDVNSLRFVILYAFASFMVSSLGFCFDNKELLLVFYYLSLSIVLLSIFFAIYMFFRFIPVKKMYNECINDKISTKIGSSTESNIPKPDAKNQSIVIHIDINISNKQKADDRNNNGIEPPERCDSCEQGDV